MKETRGLVCSVILLFLILWGCQKKEQITTERAPVQDREAPVEQIERSTGTAEPPPAAVSEEEEEVKEVTVQEEPASSEPTPPEPVRAEPVSPEPVSPGPLSRGVLVIPEKPAPEKPEPVAVAAGAEFVGAKKCKACHIKQFRSWEKTSMGTSFDNLLPGIKADAKKKAGLDPNKDYTGDAGCLRCHTTGYGKPGGFRSYEETPQMINVQCEECHGPGGDYNAVMKKNKQYKKADIRAAGYMWPSEHEKDCMRCHGPDSPFNEKLDPKYKFIFKERLKGSHEHYPLKYEH